MKLRKLTLWLASACLFTTALLARDPWLEPFHENSIWNHPIGANAQLVPAGLGAEPNLDVDREIFVRTNWSDPAESIRVPSSWGQRWPGSPASWLGQMHVPFSFFRADANPPTTPNNPSAFLMPDKATLVQLAPTTRVTAGEHIVGYRSRNVYLYGMGEKGGHGGSNLSSIGGSIRTHEWGSNKEIRHAIKVNVHANEYLYYDSGTKGFRWPADTADSYAAGTYGGTRPATRMGALLTFQPGTTHNSIGGLSTSQARKIFDAIYKYGAYIVDDTAWNAHAICAEDGVDIPIGNSAFRADVNRIFQNLHVVNNNSSSNIGGGGALRTGKLSSLGAPIGAQISLQAKANGGYVTADSGGWDALEAFRSLVGLLESFEVVDAGNGYIALKSLANNRYVTVDGPSDILFANRTVIGNWEQFTWEYHDGGKSIALKAKKNGKYVVAESGGADSLRANRSSVGGWEKFTPGGSAGVWTESGSSQYYGVPGK